MKLRLSLAGLRCSLLVAWWGAALGVLPGARVLSAEDAAGATPTSGAGTTPPRAAAPPALAGISGGGSVELGQRVVLLVLPAPNPTGENLSPFSYQWRRNGTNIAGATASSLELSAVTANDGGTYSVVVSNADGSSVAATDVSVKPAAAPVITTQPRTQTASVGQAVTFTFVATGSYPRTHQWRKDGNPLAGATDATLTLDRITTNEAGSYGVVVSNSQGSVLSSSASLTVNAATPPVLSTFSPSDTTLPVGQRLQLSASFNSGSSPFTYQWARDGEPIAGATASVYTVAAVTAADAGRYAVTVANAAGSATSRTAVVTITPATPVVFLSNPSNQTLFVGQLLNLNVSVSGSSPITYQWQKDGVVLPGATGSSYSRGGVALTDAGRYVLVATNAAGAVSSSAATVTVNPPTVPVITTQPVGANVAFGNSFTLGVQVSGSPTFSYVWRRDGVALSGATNATYTLGSATPAASGVYSVVVTNSAGSVTSVGATITVAAATVPAFTTQPADRQVTIGSSASFSINYTSTGAGAVTLQWLKNGAPIAGANSSSYSISAVRDTDAAAYSVFLTGAGGSVTSAAAKLTVLPLAPPSVGSWSLITDGVALGTRATLSPFSSSGGSSSFAYQWYRNGVALPGQTAASLVINSVTVDDYATYTLTVANEAGLISSPALWLMPTVVARDFSSAPATPWLDVGRVGDTVYFLATAPGRIERYDLAAERWLPAVVLSETQVPTAFAPAAEGVYLAYGRALVRRGLDLTGETPLLNTTGNITMMFTHGSYLYHNAVSSGSSGGSTTLGTVHRTTLQAGPTSNLSGISSGLQGVSLAPALSRGFGRTTGISPSDITMFALAANGTISNLGDSPYHGDMPGATRTFVLPGEQTVADDSGTVYRSGNLGYLGSFGRALTDLAFLADGTPVVLRGPLVSLARADTYVETARTALPRSGHRIFTRGSDVFVFGAAAATTPFAVDKVSAAGIAPVAVPVPAPAPVGRYSIDDAFLGEGNIVHIFSRSLPGFVRWDPATRTFLPTLPLRHAPARLTHQPGNRRALAHYADGALSEIPLVRGGTERVLLNLSHSTRALVDLGDFISANIANAGNSGDQRFLLAHPSGPRTLNTSLYEATGLAWQAATRRLYSTPSFSSASLQYEVVTPAGTLERIGSSSFNTTVTATGTVTPPIRFNADGTLLASRNGRVLNADLASVGTLANDIEDAAWLGNNLYTLRSRDGQTQVQQWARATYIQSGTLQLPGSPVRLFALSATQLLAVTNVQGYVAFTVINANLSIDQPAGVGDRAGVYFAALGGAANAAGDVALYLRPDGSGTLLVASSNPRATLSATNVVVGPDGGFIASARDLATGASRTVAGAVAADGTLSGSLPALNLTFTGSRAVGTAPAGLYQAASVNGATGGLVMIAGPDGRALVAAQSGSTAEGGLAFVDAQGRAVLITSTGARLTVAADAGAGTAVATADRDTFATVTFAGLRDDVARTDRLANISTRGRVGTGEDAMIAGFVVTGSAPRSVLVRAVGPALAAFGLGGAVADPKLTVFRGDSRMAESDDWSTESGAAGIVAASAKVGAFALPFPGKDAALLLELAPGSYTAQVAAATGAGGVALVEVYDAGDGVGASAPKFVNIATRGRVGTGEDAMIAGIVVSGNVPKRVLVRAVGPTLAGFGVGGSLADPVLTVLSSAGTTLVSSDDWGVPAGGVAPSDVSLAASTVGAFPLVPNSRDAALLITLRPGAYTAQVTGKGATGVVLVEVYEVAP